MTLIRQFTENPIDIDLTHDLDTLKLQESTSIHPDQLRNADRIVIKEGIVKITLRNSITYYLNPGDTLSLFGYEHMESIETVTPALIQVKSLSSVSTQKVKLTKKWREWSQHQFNLFGIKLREPLVSKEARNYL